MTYETRTETYSLRSLAVAKGMSPQEAARLERIVQESKDLLNPKDGNAVKYSACCI